MSNKKLRQLFMILIIVVSLFPIVVITFKYNIVTQISQAPKVLKWSIFAMLAILGIFIGTFKRVNKLLKQMEFSIIKSIASGVYYLIPSTITLSLLIGLTYIIKDLVYIFYWIEGCSVIVFLILIPGWQYYNNKCKDDHTVSLIKRGTEK